MLDKSSVYNVLAEGMYFLGKSSPSTFNFLVKCKTELKVSHLKVLKREWKVGGGGGGKVTPDMGVLLPRDIGNSLSVFLFLALEP